MKVAVAGAGDIAKYLVEALRNQDYDVVILTRSPKPFLEKLEQRTTDYSLESIRAHVADCDALISSITGYATDFVRIHLDMLEACRKSPRCKRFLPSVWAGNYEEVPDQPIYVGDDFSVILNKLRARDEVKWTFFCQGWMSDYLLPTSQRHFSDYGDRWVQNYEKKEFTLYGNGSQKVDFTSAKDATRGPRGSLISVLELVFGLWTMPTLILKHTLSVPILSPIQPSFAPVNCIFEVDDLEKEWTWSEPFDFIFARSMMGSFADWPAVIEQAYNNLEPGGYFEIHDIIYPLLCDDDTVKEDTPISRWARLMLEACEKIGRSVTIGRQFPQLLREAGFEEVTETKCKAPLSDWPKDPKWKEVGSMVQASLLSGLEGLSLALFTRVLDWTRAETLVFCAQVRNDVKNTNLHGYYDGMSVYGRKPLLKKD